MTTLLYRDDPYRRDCEARIEEVNDRGGITLDQTIFYPTSGGQPGDRGKLDIDGFGVIDIATTVYDEDREIVHVAADSTVLPEPGMSANLMLDWDARYRHMRMHTCMHLLCSVVPYPVTGGQISEDSGRIDFDIADPTMADKEEITAKLNALIQADHPVSERWITDEELAAQPDLVRTMAVKPPMGSGRVRLVEIGGGEIDLQPCGGTHVRSTGEIGEVAVTKIEKKGRQNRRIRMAFV